MKRALIIGNASSKSVYANGSTIRLNTIVSVLQQEGYLVEIFDDRETRQLSEWDLFVALGPSEFRKAQKLSTENSKIWLDLCDSWVYSRFSWSTGPRLFLIGISEIFIFMKYIRAFKHTLITYISPLDLELDNKFLTLLGASKPEVLANHWVPIRVGGNTHGKRRMIFVGNGKYFPNLLAILELSILIFPRLTPPMSAKTIHVYGNSWPKWINFLPNIIYHGFEEKSKVYFPMDIHLAPMRQKAGIKNKIVIPLISGLKVVAYESGINGIPIGQNLTICKNSSDFVRGLSQLLEMQINQRVKDLPKVPEFKLNPNIINWIKIDRPAIF